MKAMGIRSGSPIRPVFFAALVLGACGGRAALSEEDNQELRFVRGLIERGWTVVADPVIERALKAAGPADKDRFVLLRAQLLLQGGKDAAGARPRAEAFKKAFAAIEELIPADKRLKTDGVQGAELGDFLISGASLLGEAARRESEAARVAELRKYALRMIDAASQVFKARVEAARQAGGTRGQAEEEEESADSAASRDEMDAAYNLARAGFERGLLVDDKKEKTAALVEARKGFEDFQATFAETPLAFESGIFIGRIWNELENPAKAMEAFEGAASLTELFKDDRGNVHVDHPLAADIVQRALFLKAQAGNKCQKYAEAREAAFRALKLFPKIRRTPIGWAIRLEGGQALAKLGKVQEASRMFREVEQEDPEGPGGIAARERLRPFVTIDSGGADAAIRGMREKGDVPGAIRVCRQILSRLDPSNKQSNEKAAPILLEMGRTYSQTERQREAALVYEDLAERAPDHKLAPEAVFQAMKARLLANSKAPSKIDADRYEDNLKKLMSRYPDSPQAAAAKYLKGEEAMEAGRWVEAKTLYLEVPENAGIYRDNALYQAGLAMWMQGLRWKTAKERSEGYQEAEKLFQGCLAIYLKEDARLDPERLQNRVKLRIATRVKLADIYSSPTVKKYGKALEQIEAVEREETVDNAQTVLLGLSRARALANLERLDEAVRALEAVRKADRDNRSLPILSHEIALGFDRQAQKSRQEAKGEKSEKEYRANLVKALEYYAQWLDDSKRFKLRISPKMATDTADRALAIALEVTELPEKKDSFTDALDRVLPGRNGGKALPRAEWERAARLLEEARPKRIAGQATDWLPLVKLGRAYGFLGDWAKARDALEEALVWGGLLASTGEASPAPKFEALNKAPDLLDIFIDLGFTELIPAKKGGLARAQAIFDKAAQSTGMDRESCAFWKCRYGILAAETKEGNYERAHAQLNIVRGKFPEWDKGGCGLKERFEELKKELEAKLPTAPGK
jgi:TolA-binding protein